MFELLSAIFAIIIIDLILSGDNAVVIGMAASRLPADQRRRAILWGGVGAVGLRITFTVMAALLLQVPLLQAIGGILLIWISIRLLQPAAEAHNIAPAQNFRGALKTIIMADVIMSLDNILAVGGAARGHIWLLLFGLALSIPILLFFSSIIARMIHRFPILNYIGAGILVITAVRMFFEDPIIHDNFHTPLPLELVIGLIVMTLVLGYGYLMNRRARQRVLEAAQRVEPAAPEQPVHQSESAFDD